jgi:hypothetical protein
MLYGHSEKSGVLYGNHIDIVICQGQQTVRSLMRLVVTGVRNENFI